MLLEAVGVGGFEGGQQRGHEEQKECGKDKPQHGSSFYLRARRMPVSAITMRSEMQGLLISWLTAAHSESHHCGP